MSVGPRQQLVDGAIGMTVDDPGEDVGQVAERIDIVQLTGLDQGGDGGPMFGAAIRACEQRVRRSSTSPNFTPSRRTSVAAAPRSGASPGSRKAGRSPTHSSNGYAQNSA